MLSMTKLDTKCCYTATFFAERYNQPFMLGVFMLDVIMLSGVAPIVVALNYRLFCPKKFQYKWALKLRIFVRSS